jgi:hypothetical protein
LEEKNVQNIRKESSDKFRESQDMNDKNLVHPSMLFMQDYQSQAKIVSRGGEMPRTHTA